MDQKKAERNKRSQCESGLQMHLNPILGQDVKVFLNVVCCSTVNTLTLTLLTMFFVLCSIGSGHKVSAGHEYRTTYMLR